MIPGANYVASFGYRFPIFNLWFSWNVMAILLSLVDLCFSENKNIALSIQSCCKDIQIRTIFDTEEG